MTNSCTFGKAERLCSHKVIEALFAGGNKSFSAYPIRAIYMSMDGVGGAPCQLLISVSKRHFKHAVDRNKVKRQIREAYRLNKHILLPAIPKGKSLVVAFIWLSSEHFDTKVVSDKMIKLLLKLKDGLETAEQD